MFVPHSVCLHVRHSVINISADQDSTCMLCQPTKPQTPSSHHHFGPAAQTSTLKPSREYVDMVRFLLPTGQLVPLAPNQQRHCDQTVCVFPASPDRPVVLFSYGHSFHADCVTPELIRCFHCTQALLAAIREKATTAKQAIFDPGANVGQVNHDDDHIGEDDGKDQVNAESVADMTAAEAAVQVQVLLKWAAHLPLYKLFNGTVVPTKTCTYSNEALHHDHHNHSSTESKFLCAPF